MSSLLPHRLSAAVLALAATAVFAGPAQASLVGHSPADNADNGFPVWFQDDAGLQLQQCIDLTTRCTIAPDPAPAATDPEVFWWQASALIGTTGPTAELVLALELAQDPPPAANFTRIQVTGLDFTPGATYTVTYPYGTATVTADDNGRLIRFREETGCAPAAPGDPCDAAEAQTTRIGPFLRWSPGADTAALLAEGYIGDPTLLHTVVGSPTGNNFFRIEGPNAGGPGVDAVTQTLFSVLGQVNGTAPATPFDVWSPRALDFGSRDIGVAGPTQAVTVTNNGFGPLTVGAPNVGGGDYAIASNSCTVAVAPGGSCAIGVSWMPGAAGARTGTLSIPTSSPNGDASLATGSSRVISLNATGTIAPPPPVPTATAGGQAQNGTAANTAAGTAVAGAGAGQTGSGPALSQLVTAPKVRLRTAHRKGFFVRVKVKNGTRVHIRIRRGPRVLTDRNFAVGGGLIRLSTPALRRVLRVGNYVIEVTPMSATGTRGSKQTRKVQILL